MAGLTEFYCGWNEPSQASQFKWLEYTFKFVYPTTFFEHLGHLKSSEKFYLILMYAQRFNFCINFSS